MASPLLLGIDVGTSTAKAVLINERGELIGWASRDHPTYSPQPDFYEQDSEDWWTGVCQAIHQVMTETGSAPERIAGVSLSGQGCACLPVDAERRALGRASIWTDSRARVEQARLRQIFGDDLGRVTGNDIYDQPEPRMMWLRQHEPERYQQAEVFLTTVSFLLLRLTDMLAANRSDWGFHMAYDRMTQDWNDLFLEEAGLSSHKFPPLFASWDVVGTVTPWAAAQTGLAAGTLVVAGGQDSTVTPLAVGALASGQSVFTRGTTDLLSCCTDQPVYHPNLYTTCAVLPDLYVGTYMKEVTAAGASFKWLAKMLYREATETRFAQMSEQAGAAGAGAGGVLFLPYLLVSIQGDPTQERGGSFFGLTVSTEPGQLCRAVMEGTAYALREAREQMLEAGIEITELRATGGPTRSPVWNQIMADVTGLPVLLPDVHAGAAYGAALLAGLGVGVFSREANYAALREIIHLRSRHEPAPALHSFYDQGYNAFNQLARRSSGIIPLLRTSVENPGEPQ